MTVTDNSTPRLTPTQRLHEITDWMHEVLVATLTRRSGTTQRESITLARNAKGDVQPESITYRKDDESEDDFVTRTETRFDRLDAKYPLSRAQSFGRDYLPDEKGKK